METSETKNETRSETWTGIHLNREGEKKGNVGATSFFFVLRFRVLPFLANVETPFLPPSRNGGGPSEYGALEVVNWCVWQEPVCFLP